MSTQQPLKIDTNHPKRLPEVFEQAPKLTSLNSGWRTITLEAFCLPLGETPNSALSIMLLALVLGKGFRSTRL